MKKIIAIIIILVLLGIILFFLFSQRERPIIIDFPEPEIDQPVSEEQEIIPPAELIPEQRLDLARDQLRVLVRNFVERYGSFSTDAQFANLRELKNEMSAKFWRETENFIIANQDKEIDEFYGVSTKVLNITEISYNQDRAIFEVMTQRKETRGVIEEVLYQGLDLIAIKENGDWKIDEVKWR